jgi:hypothetical protein
MTLAVVAVALNLPSQGLAFQYSFSQTFLTIAQLSVRLSFSLNASLLGLFQLIFEQFYVLLVTFGMFVKFFILLVQLF